MKTPKIKCNAKTSKKTQKKKNKRKQTKENKQKSPNRICKEVGKLFFLANFANPLIYKTSKWTELKHFVEFEIPYFILIPIP
jgi:hypothetical protein